MFEVSRIPAEMPTSIFSTPEFSDLPDSVRTLVDEDIYFARRAIISGTTFYLLLRRKGGLKRQLLEDAIDRGWSVFSSLFSTSIKSAVLVDFNAPLGGGPLGDFSVGVFSTDEINSDSSRLIGECTGWSSLHSTEEYVETYWSEFTEPMRAYVDDTVFHELGHLIFGFGATKLPSLDHEESWFSLGLGILYDRMVWNHFYATPSPLFSAIENIWSSKFAANTMIDQRLISPDKSIDRLYGLNRIQIYGHGKSHIYLKNLRSVIGELLFDEFIKAYLSVIESDGNRFARYDEFVARLPKNIQGLIKLMENEFQIR